MRAIVEPVHSALPYSQGRPRLDSFDCGEEFSFYHWIQVYKLVDQGDSPLVDEALPCTTEFGSEVEPATAYQHVAGNVV